MADYYSLLSRAVANLPKSSPASARQAIYERARKALINQLRSLKPQLPDSDIAREESALDAAVARLEAEFEPVAVTAGPIAPPAPPAPKAPPPAPKPPDAPRPSAPAPIAPAARAPLAPPASAPKPVAAPIAPPAAPKISPPLSAAAARTAPEQTGSPLLSADTDSTAGADNAPKIGAPQKSVAATNGAARLEGEPPRPSAPSPVTGGRSNPWPWIALAVVVGLVGSVAVAAFLLREKPQDLTIKAPSEAASPGPSAPNGQKIAERVDGAPPAAPTDTPTPQPPASSAAPTPTPAPTSETAPTPPAATQPAQAAIPVAARAAMLVANVSDAQKPAVSLGTVVWSAVPANPGQPGSVGVKAEIDVPDLKMHASMILRKNVDSGLPASHTIDLRVTFEPGSPIKGVKDIALPLMRRDDPPAADALLGVRVKINDSYFLVGLNRADADVAHNIEEIGSRGWFDFPMQLSDDRIAKLTFEKGADGERIVAAAIAAWK